MTGKGSPARRFFGYPPMTIGVVIAFLSGACTLAVISTRSGAEIQPTISVALIIGGALPCVCELRPSDSSSSRKQREPGLMDDLNRPGGQQPSTHHQY